MTALLAPPSRLRDLSERVLELLALMAQGYSNSGIAAAS